MYDLKMSDKQRMCALAFSSCKNPIQIKHIELYFKILKMSRDISISLIIYMLVRFSFQKIDYNERAKKQLSNSGNIMVEIKIYWKLNQDFCQTLLFGQYVAEIFYEMKSSK